MKARLGIVFLFVVFVGLIGLIAYYRAEQRRAHVVPAVIKPAVVRCATLQPRTFQLTESFYGTVEANVRIDMAFQITGRVVQLGRSDTETLVENEAVEKGQIVARLEPDRYEAAVGQAKAGMDRAKAAMARAEAGLADTEATLADAESNLKRMRELAARSVGAKRDLEKAELAWKRAKAALAASEAVIAEARADYTGAESTRRMAEVNLADATLRSPFDGVVAVIPTEVGQIVQAGEPVVTLVDLSRLKLVVGVVERRLPLLKVDQPVVIEILALEAQARVVRDRSSLAQQRHGVVSMVPPAADPRDGLFKIEIELAGGTEGLMPGMVARATVTVMEKRTLAVPADAAVRTGDSAFAFFLGTGYPVGLDLGPIGRSVISVPATVARRVEFEPDVFDKDFYLVEDLPEGSDLLVVEGFTRLADGDLVRMIGEPILLRSSRGAAPDL